MPLTTSTDTPTVFISGVNVSGTQISPPTDFHNDWFIISHMIMI